jgi:anthranilate phosphoribosyltransferase
MKKILNHLFDHKTLTKSEAEEVLTNIAGGSYSDPEIAAFITVYLMRAITVDEMSGFRDALLNLCQRVDLNGFDTIDLCGTGGDGKDTFNISTISVFITAGAGAKVAKHGNYAVSSSCGSSNVMELLGYRFSTDNDKLKGELEKTGVCFMHAPLFNPAMKNVVPVRRSLRVKTFFNMLGPMVNPAFPDKQMVGVFSPAVARLYNYLYQTGGKEYIIIHSLDGYDEVSLTSPFKYLSGHTELLLGPKSFLLPQLKPEDIAGGSTPEESTRIFRDILKGEGTTAQRNVVLANSAVALKCYYPQMRLTDTFAMAAESLDSGRAMESLNNLISMQ